MDTLNTISGNSILAKADWSKWDYYLDNIIRFCIKFLVALIVLFIGKKIINVFRKLLGKALEKKGAETGVRQFLDSFLKFSLYIVLVLMIAGYFGLQTTSLMALLGSAGVAIALALQGSLSNFTGGVLILILKPFKVGDYIIEDNKGNEGTVIEIQLFYTKLRTIDDKIVILPNGTLANTSMTNVTASPCRRVIIKVGISYASDIKTAKKIIRKIINEHELTVKSRDIDVFVDSLDESQVTIGVRYFVNNDDYFESKWFVTEEIKSKLEANHIVIPYNQLDVHIDGNVVK